MQASSAATAGARPLDGIRVLELGQLMAGPLAGTYLGYFGAEVIKVEDPEAGDPVRGWRVLDEDGTSLWWRSLGRNKRLITLDLRTEEGRAEVRRLAATCDVLIENFRPGRMEAWGLGPDDLRPGHPGLVYVRVSGFGQEGPYAQRRGFASVCEAVGGLRHVTGHPGEVPVRSNLSLGDTFAAHQAVIGTLLAITRRERDPERRGQVVDVAIAEAVLNVMEAAVSEYDRCGAIREPSGTTITGVVPTDAYPCSDGRRVVIGANGDSIFQRLMETAGRGDMAHDERYATNKDRMRHQAAIDEAIAAWTSTLPCAEVVRRLEAAGVPAGPINSAKDLREDPHFLARGQMETVEVNGAPVVLPALGPKLLDTPGRTDFAGGELGQDNEALLGGD
ncbi:MAG: CoA transferase [Planctomycetota bacterium]|nr:CoA transferase [Planctomycetota bacterium]